MDTPRRNHARKLALAASATILSLLVAEVALRVFAPLDLTLYQPDPLLLYAPRPNARRVFARAAHNGGGSIEVRFNEHGYRGPELASSPVKRVVLYGDSYLEADLTPVDKTFAADLERRLDARLGRRVEVVNAGVAAYGPDQAGLRMERELADLQPDLVVLAIFSGNDFGDVLRNRIFELDASGQLSYAPHPLDDDLRKTLARASNPSWLASLQLAIRAATAWEWIGGGLSRVLFGWTPVDYLDRSLTLSRAEYRDAVVDRIPVVVNLFDDHYDADIALEPDSPAARYKVALFARVLVWFRDVVAKAGRPLALLIIPSPIDACDHYFGWVDPAVHPLYERPRLSRIVGEIARRENVALLDLYPAMRAAGSECLYYDNQDNHLNEKGQELAARLFDEFLATTGLLQ